MDSPGEVQTGKLGEIQKRVCIERKQATSSMHPLYDDLNIRQCFRTRQSSSA